MPADGSEHDVATLCRLARLDLDAAARARLADRLGRIMAAFAELAAVDTRRVVPRAPAPMRCRPDEPAACLPPEQVLGNSARTAADCFLVPRVVEG